MSDAVTVGTPIDVPVEKPSVINYEIPYIKQPVWVVLLGTILLVLMGLFFGIVVPKAFADIETYVVTGDEDEDDQ